MPGQTLQAELVLSAKDNSAAALGKLQKDIAAVKKSIETFRAALTKFNASRTDFRNAQQAVERAAAAMRSTAAPTAAMTRAYEQAQRAVSRASAAFDAQKAAVLGAKREIDGFGISVSRLASAENRLKTAAAEADAALARQQQRAARWRSAGGSLSTIGMFAGPGLLAADKKAVAAGAAYQHELAFAYPAAGIGASEAEWARNSASALATRYPIVSSPELLKLYRETRSVISGEVGGRSGLSPAQRLAIAARDTQRVFPSVARAEAALKAGGGDPGDLQRLVKGMEALGITQDPARTESILDAYVRATQVAGSTIPVEGVLRAIQQMMGVGGQLSDRFIKSTFLSLVQEGGSRVGAGIGAMDMNFLGEMKNKQAEEWKKLGFLSDADLIRTKTGAVKGLMPGHNIRGWQLALSDPDQFLWQMVRPALEGHGFTTTQSQIAEVQRLFGSARGRRIAAALLQQQPTYEQAAAKFDSALGLGAADQTGRSASAALQELTTALTTFAAAVTSPLMDHAAKVLDTLAHGLASAGAQWEKFAKKNPQDAELIGGAGVGAAGYYGVKWTLGLLGRIFGRGAPAAGEAGAASGAGWLGSVTGPAAMALAFGLATKDAFAAGDQQINDALRRHYGNVPWLPGEPLQSNAAKPEVKGSADLNVTVQVEPSDSFLSRVETVVRNAINAIGINGGEPGSGVGTAGSTGLSMPPAVPTP